MDDNRIEGGIKNVAGKIESAFGDVTGDAKTQVEGRSRSAEGQIQQGFGDAMDTLRDYTTDNPVGALLTAGAIGLLMGMLLARR